MGEAALIFCVRRFHMIGRNKAARILISLGAMVLIAAERFRGRQDGCTTDWVRLVNTLVDRQLHGLRLGGRHGGRQGLQVPGLGHCVAGFRNSGAENDLGELGQG
jgi:hypothetical protein